MRTPSRTYATRCASRLSLCLTPRHRPLTAGPSAVSKSAIQHQLKILVSREEECYDHDSEENEHEHVARRPAPVSLAASLELGQVPERRG